MVHLEYYRGLPIAQERGSVGNLRNLLTGLALYHPETATIYSFSGLG